MARMLRRPVPQRQSLNPFQPTDQPAENGANMRRLKQTEPLAVGVSHRAVVDEQGIGLRPIGPPQGMHVAAEAISHKHAGFHAMRWLIPPSSAITESPHPPAEHRMGDRHLGGSRAQIQTCPTRRHAGCAARVPAAHPGYPELECAAPRFGGPRSRS
jgi:hypothetical protein